MSPLWKKGEIHVSSSIDVHRSIKRIIACIFSRKSLKNKIYRHPQIWLIFKNVWANILNIAYSFSVTSIKCCTAAVHNFFVKHVSVLFLLCLYCVYLPVIYRRSLFPPLYITKTGLFKYIENLTSKNWKFSLKKSDIFHISAQNIDCGYSLEPPRRGGSNEYHNLCFWAEIKKKIMYTPVNPSFTI